jgi:hypothetical protein
MTLFSNSDYTASNKRMISKDESWNLPGGSEENHEKPQSG